MYQRLCDLVHSAISTGRPESIDDSIGTVIQYRYQARGSSQRVFHRDPLDIAHRPWSVVIRDVVRGGSHWAMPTFGTEGALCDCSAPSNRECVYRENVVGGRAQAPYNDEKSLRKVPPKSPSNDGRTTPSLGEVAPFYPLLPLRDFRNTLLVMSFPRTSATDERIESGCNKYRHPLHVALPHSALTQCVAA